MKLDKGRRREVDDLEALGLCELELLELVEEGRHGVARLSTGRVHAVLEVPQGLRGGAQGGAEGPRFDEVSVSLEDAEEGETWGAPRR